MAVPEGSRRAAVRYLPGVIGVSNLITVKPRVAPTEIKAKIEDALKRSAETGRQPHHCRGGGRQGDPARHRALDGPKKRRPHVRPGPRRGSTSVENLITVVP